LERKKNTRGKFVILQNVTSSLTIHNFMAVKFFSRKMKHEPKERREVAHSKTRQKILQVFN